MNKKILIEALNRHFRDENFHAIADETFVRALPFTRKDITANVVSDLSTYSKSIIESLGGFKMVMESLNNTNMPKLNRLYLQKIYDICTESAEDATAEVVKDIDFKNEDRSVEEIVTTSEPSQELHDEFCEKAKTLNLNKIADIIKNKTIDVIRSEKHALEEEERIEQELKDAVVDTDASEEEQKNAVESFIHTNLDKHLPRKHISLFTKLQNVAFESLLYSTEKFSVIPVKTLTDMTINSTLNIFKHQTRSPLSALESAVTYVIENDVSNVDTEKVSNDSMVCTIIMYTLLETLKTLNVNDINKEDIKNFVDSPSKIKEDIINNKEATKNIIMAELTNFENMIYRSNEIEFLKRVVAKIDSARNYINEGTPEEIKIKIEKICTIANDRITMIEKNNTPKTEFSKYELINKEKTIAEFNKLYMMFDKNPNISEIRLIMNKEKPDTDTIDICCVGHKGEKISNTFIPISYTPAFGSVCGYVKESVSKSNLMNGSKSISIYYDNGRDKELIK